MAGIDQLVQMIGAGLSAPPLVRPTPPTPRVNPRRFPVAPATEAPVPPPGTLPADRPGRVASPGGNAGMDRLRDILTAAAVGTAGVPSTAGIVSSLAGGFAGAQGYKRDAERQAAADAVKADDRAYERERQARADKLALEDRTYERGRDVKADKRADEKFALDTRKAVAEIKKIENADGSLTRSEVIQIERLVNDRAQKLGLNDTLLDADERNTRLQQLEAYRNDLEARVRGDAPEPVAPAGDVPVVNSPAEAARLPSGTVFRTPDGRTKVVP